MMLLQIYFYCGVIAIYNVMVTLRKGVRIQTQFLFFVKKSILYAKITVSQTYVDSKLSF